MSGNPNQPETPIVDSTAAIAMVKKILPEQMAFWIADAFHYTGDHRTRLLIDEIVALAEGWCPPEEGTTPTAEELDELRQLHHTPYVDEEHQGGNCIDVIMEKSAELERVRAALGPLLYLSGTSERLATGWLAEAAAGRIRAALQLCDEGRPLADIRGALSYTGSLPQGEEQQAPDRCPSGKAYPHELTAECHPPKPDALAEAELKGWKDAMAAMDALASHDLEEVEQRDDAESEGQAIAFNRVSAIANLAREYPERAKREIFPKYFADRARGLLATATPGLAEALDSVRGRMATDSRDWALTRLDAWLYGVFVGWECEEDHAHDEVCGGSGSLDEVAAQHGWNDNLGALDMLRKYRAAVAAVTTRMHAPELTPDPDGVTSPAANEGGRVDRTHADEEDAELAADPMWMAAQDLRHQPPAVPSLTEKEVQEDQPC